MTDKSGSVWTWLCGDTTPRDRRNLRRLAWLAAAWAVSFVGGTQLLEHGLAPPAPLSWGLALLPTVLALFALLAFVRYLREADELQRTLHLQALALGFGGGWLAVAGYRLFELLGAPLLDRGDVLLVMAVLYSVSVLLLRRRYR